MILDPNRLKEHSAHELLSSAENGALGVDHRLLHALLDDPEKTLPEIVRFAAEDHSSAPVLLELDLVNIFRHLKAPEAVPFLIRMAEAYPENIDDEVVETFALLGQPSLEPLLDLYARTMAPEASSEVAFALAGLGIKDERIRKVLLDRLDLGPHEALFHLEVYNDPSVIPDLEARAQSLEGEPRQDYEDTIRDLGAAKPSTVNDKYEIWADYPEEALPEFSVLTQEELFGLVESPVAEWRAEAVGALGDSSEGIEAPVLAKLIELARTDPAPEVRSRSWEAFSSVDGQPELRKLMMERLAAPETPAEERAGLVIGLSRHADQPLVRDAVLDLLENSPTRSRALRAMWDSYEPAFLDQPAKYLDDPDSEVRRAAILSVGYLGLENLGPRMEEFFADDETRQEALFSYASVAPGPLTRRKTLELLKAIEKLAAGYGEGDEAAVKSGLNVRMSRDGKQPVFNFDDNDPQEVEPGAPAQAVSAKIGRNDPCPCGSGKKYKKCCGQ